MYINIFACSGYVILTLAFSSPLCADNLDNVGAGYILGTFTSSGSGSAAGFPELVSFIYNITDLDLFEFES
ncbi:hypothetical protein D3C76_740990 [compost metagenome]